MYSYESDSDRPRTYRPDLLPIITKWLALVPESEWQYFVGFRVGTCGEFIAKFMKQPTRGGPLRLVTCVVDHDRSEMRTDTGVWIEDAPVRLTAANLTLAVDTF
jgi:hypothetical protein